jgi:hypothetical protein
VTDSHCIINPFASPLRGSPGAPRRLAYLISQPKNNSAVSNTSGGHTPVAASERQVDKHFPDTCRLVGDCQLGQPLEKRRWNCTHGQKELIDIQDDHAGAGATCRHRTRDEISQALGRPPGSDLAQCVARDIGDPARTWTRAGRRERAHARPPAREVAARGCDASPPWRLGARYALREDKAMRSSAASRTIREVIRIPQPTADRQ